MGLNACRQSSIQEHQGSSPTERQVLAVGHVSTLVAGVYENSRGIGGDVGRTLKVPAPKALIALFYFS